MVIAAVKAPQLQSTSQMDTDHNEIGPFDVCYKKIGSILELLHTLKIPLGMPDHNFWTMSCILKVHWPGFGIGPPGTPQWVLTGPYCSSKYPTLEKGKQLGLTWHNGLNMP